MSIGILNRKARDKEYAWRSLGLVPNYTKEDARGKMSFRQSGHIGYKEFYGYMEEQEALEGGLPNNNSGVHQAADYHTILGALVESLKGLIAEGMIVNIKYKGQLYEDCELVFFVPFIKCDGDEGDKLCLHYRSRNSNVQQLCRYCDCLTKDTDNPLARFKYKEEEHLKKLLRRKKWEELQKLSQIGVQNAFHGVRFGKQNERGIHGACPLDMLHAILLGIFVYTRDCFFEQIGPSSQSATLINGEARNIGMFLARQWDRDKPRTKFARGIDQGKLMAKEYTGVLLIMAALLRSEAVRTRLLHQRLNRFSENQLKDWVTLVDTLLQWEAYLKLERMEAEHVGRLERKHRWLLNLLKVVGKRKKGMGFKVMKFHGILHLSEDIKMFGIPMNVDTGSNESHHKITKVAAKLTQKDPTTFEHQTLHRLDDLHTLDLAFAELKGRCLWQYEEGYRQAPAAPMSGEGHDNSNGDDDASNHTGGMKFEVYQGAHNNRLLAIISGKAKNKEYPYQEAQLLSFVAYLDSKLSPYTDTGKLQVYSEHRRRGVMFRSHPNYRNKGPWRDWAMVQWGRRHGNLPAKIWGFIELTKLEEAITKRFPWGDMVLTNGTYAIIESTHYSKEIHRNGDSLFVELKLDTAEEGPDGEVRKRLYYLVDVQAFKDPLVVIPNVGTKNRYLLMTPRSKWPDLFISWLKEKHQKIHEDDEEDEDDVPDVD